MLVFSHNIESEVSVGLSAFREEDEQGNVFLDPSPYAESEVGRTRAALASNVEERFRLDTQRLFDHFVKDRRNETIFERCEVNDLPTAIDYIHGIPLQKVMQKA